MNPLDLVNLTELMACSKGSPEVKIGLIDGPVAANHPDLEGANIREIPESKGAVCSRANSAECLHGTFIAGILSAKRESPAPAICPDCSLLVRPIFIETNSGAAQMPRATPKDLAEAILECINAGADVINMSLALTETMTRRETALDEALDQAVKHGVIMVAAAGNQGTLGSSAITRHPWVIPVVACDLAGRPLSESNLGRSISRNGLSAPGDGITSLASGGQTLRPRGTSVAVPFVTGAIALLWSEYPAATAAQVRFAVTLAGRPRQASVVPLLLDAARAWRNLSGVR